MRQVISVYLPTWATDRLRRRLGTAAPSADTPVVLAGRNGGRREVTAVDQTARGLGVRPGMSATEVQALLPNLATYDAEPHEDEAGLGRLAQRALRRYSPVVAADPPDGLAIDATGAVHLHGGELSMLNDVVARLAGAGIAARVAMAGTLGGAHALARHHERPVSAFGMRDGTVALARLPVSALRLGEDAVRSLRALGFERVGDLLAQPRSPLVRRFGLELGRRLDQALGDLAEPITPVAVPNTVGVSRGFGEPISAPETIRRHAERLAADLCVQLERRGLGARMAFRLGYAAIHGPQVRPPVHVHRAVMVAANGRGFALLRGSEEKLIELFDDWAMRHRRTGDYWGNRVVYGALYRWLEESTDQSGSAYAPIRKAIEAHALHSHPIDVREKRYAGSLDKRNFVTLSHLVREAGLGRRTVESVLTALAIKTEDELKGSGQDILIPYEAFQHVSALLASAINQEKAACHLGLGANVFQKLVETKLIEPFAKSSAHRTARYLFTRAYLDVWIDRLAGSATIKGRVSKRLVDLVTASVLTKAPVEQLVAAVEANKLRCVGRLRGAKPFTSLLFERDQVEALWGLPSHAMARDQVVSYLGIWRRTLHRLELAGHLTPLEVPVRIVGHSIKVFDLEAVHQFRRRYISATDAAKHLGTSHVAIGAKLERLGVRPAIAMVDARGANHYDRGVIEALPKNSLRTYAPRNRRKKLRP